CLARRKRCGKTSELFACHRREKLNTGKAGGGEKLRELFFGGSAFKRHAIQKQLRSAGAEEQAVFGTRGDRHSQLVPSCVHLLDGANVVVAVEACKLQQNVEAANECAPCRCCGVRLHPVGSPKFSKLTL